MPSLDFSDLQDDSGMDLDSEIPLMHSQDSHSGIQLEPSLNFASIEFNRQSGKRMRTNRGNLPFDIWDNAASNAMPTTLPAANPAPTQIPLIKSLRRQHHRTCLTEPQRRSMDTASRSATLPRPSPQRTSLRRLPTIQPSQAPQ